jgi:hypothetical protein
MSAGKLVWKKLKPLKLAAEKRLKVEIGKRW